MLQGSTPGSLIFQNMKNKKPWVSVSTGFNNLMLFILVSIIEIGFMGLILLKISYDSQFFLWAMLNEPPISFGQGLEVFEGRINVKVNKAINIFYYGFCIFAESFQIGWSEVGQISVTRACTRVNASLNLQNTCNSRHLP